MPRTTSSNYDTYNTGDKSPVAIVELLDKDDTVVAKYSSGTFNNIGSTGHKKYVRKIKISSDTLDILSTFFLDRGVDISAEILDSGLDVTSELAGDVVTKIQAKIGFAEIDDTDFISLPIQNIKSTDVVNDDLSYNFTTRSIRSLLYGNIFRNLLSAKLASPGLTDDDSVAIMVVDGVDNLIPPQVFTTGTNGGFSDWLLVGLEVDNEYIKHNGTAGPILGIVRGSNSFFTTTVTAHDVGAPVRQFLYTNPSGINPWTWADILLFILHTTTDGSGHEFYDLARLNDNFQGFGYGLTADQVETEKIERLGYKTNIWKRTFRDNFYIMKDETDGVSWLTENILKPNNLLAYINESGKFDLKLIDYIEIDQNFSSEVTFDNDSVVAASLTFDPSYVKNKLDLTQLSQDESVFGSLVDYATSFKAELDNSITSFGDLEALQFKVPVLGIGPASTTLYREYYIASRWLYFLANIPAFVRIKTTFENWHYTIGDFCQLTWDRFPNLKDGTRGWTTERALIVGQEATFDFASEPPNFEFYYDLYCFEVTDKLGSFYTLVDKIEEGDITDTEANLSATATLSDPPEAADAHHDFTSTVQGDIWKATVRITPPNSGSTEHVIRLQLDAAEDSGGYTTNGTALICVRYNSGDSTAFEVEVIWGMATSNNCDRVYLQWYDASATGGSGERPTDVELIQVEYYTLDQSITTN